MNKLQKKFWVIAIFGFLVIGRVFAQQRTDILIVGGGAGGTAAAIQAARSGTQVTLLEKTPWLGGMLTSAGVSAIDGNHNMPSGIWGEFRDSLYAWYGGPNSVATGWVSHTLFEPSIGSRILRNMANHPNIKILFNSELQSATFKNGIWYAVISSGKRQQELTSKILIDATERGEVLEQLQIPYRLGMDSRAETGEPWAPERYSKIVQDLTYVAILEDVGASRTKKGLVRKPKNYNRSDFECACKREEGEMFEAILDCEQMLNYAKLPGGKYMLNWPNCGNDFFMDWPNMSKSEQATALEKAKMHTQGFVYYIQEELGFKNLRLADEFPSKDGFALIPYDRESRRVKGKVYLTANHLERPFDFSLYRTGIAVGDYPIDHHHDKNPNAPEIDFISIRIPSYNIPLGSLIPEDTPNFIVAEKNISVSNIANGTTRLQPVVLGIGQAAGALAALSIHKAIDPASVPVRAVQEELVKHKAYLMPYMDVSKIDPGFEAMQRIGATGILKGIGIPYKWANETWFYPDRLVSEFELLEGLYPLYPAISKFQGSGKSVTPEFISQLGVAIHPDFNLDQILNICRNNPALDIETPDYEMDRRETSILLDSLLQPFAIPVDYFGNFTPEK